MRFRQPCVYILASGPRGTLYVGVTSDVLLRTRQHQNGFVDGFPKRYHVHSLVWYELHSDMYSAISREKAPKAWKRLWKIQLVETGNPAWRDLYPDIIDH